MEVTKAGHRGSRYGLVVHRIHEKLGWWEELACDWVCFGPNVAFQMHDGSWLCPDSAVVRRERYREGIPEGPTPFSPDVAFEVLSADDSASEVQQKRRLYSLSNVVQVWVNPDAETIGVISPSRPAEYFGREDTVVVKELPGLGLNLFPLVSKRVKDGEP
jgi:Uma2 family endonuclease